MQHSARRAPLIGVNMNYYKDPKKPLSSGECRVGFAYIESVRRAGGVPVLVPCIHEEKALARFVESVDGFVFIGGKDYPPVLYGQRPSPKVNPLPSRRVATDLLLARLVRRRGLPVLGICGGHQLINIERGGSLIQHIPRAEYHVRKKNVRRLHWATVTGGEILKGIFGTRRFVTNSSHHQAINPKKLGRGLQIVALASDGTVEAAEAVGERFVLCVQWHPEGMPNVPRQRQIFGALVKAASLRRPSGKFR